ncbi:asparagine synthetase B family protein, partial [Vibrio sp. V10_P2A27P122]|uniref:asparagine synthetase B family protein n=2 Tax=unclassified Vibrio TaxID=2614977 RepID=UPI000B9F4492
IEAGHYMEVSKNDIKTVKYWDVADYLNKISHDDYVTSIDNSKRLLEESMVHRSVSDVPISIALSGGLDSSLNLSYTKDIRADNIHAINVSYEQTSEFDESRIAKQFAEEQSVSYSSNPISEATFIEWLEEYLANCTDIPAGDPNTPLLYGICKLSRQDNYKVLLVGEGGDELGGYPIYKKLELLDKINKFVPNFVFSFFSKMPIPYSVKKKMNRLKAVPPIAQRFIFGFSEDVKQSFWKGNKEYDSYKVIDELAEQVHVKSSDSFLRRLVNVEYKLRLAELLLPRVDYPSMAASIEARSPFMDHRLIEYTSTLPWQFKMKNGPKSILKEIAKERLPNYIMDAPKVGFGMLLTPFLVNTLPDWFENEILKSESKLKSYVDESFLHSLHREHKITKDKGYQMWILYSLHKWLEVNFK